MKPTKSMANAAKEGLKLHEEGKSSPGMPPRAVEVGKKIAAAQSLSPDHILDMAHIHASHDVCPKDCEDLLWGGPAGEQWAKSNLMRSMAPLLSENEKKLDSLIEDKTNLSFEIYSDINLEEPINLEEDDDGLIWAPIVRSGMLATRPGPNGEKLDEPLVFVPGSSKDQKKEIGLEDIINSFNDKAIEHVTLPIDVRIDGENVPAHNNGLYQNTGFIRKLKMADSKILQGEKVILGGHDFTEPDIKGKVERGTIPSRSCGLLYDYKNTTTGKVYPIVLEHTALTSKPWIGGIAAYGSSEFSDRQVIPMMLSEKPFISKIEKKSIPTKLAQETTTSETNKVRSDSQSEFLADVQWGDTPSFNDIRNQIESILDKMTPDFDSYPSYYLIDLTDDKCLIKVNYGIGPDQDAWVCPYSVEGEDVKLAPFTDWIDVTKKWVSDTVDPIEDKKKLEMSEKEIKLGTLSSKQRKDLPDSDFIFPSEKRYPIPDLAHARNALARVAQNGTSEEQSKVKNAVYKRYPVLKSDSSTKMSESPLQAASKRRGGDALDKYKPTGGPMNLLMSEEQIERLGLDEGPAKEVLIKQNELLRKQNIELAESKRAEKETRVAKRMDDLKNEFSEDCAGLLKEIEATYLSDDGDVALELKLSESGYETKVSETATQMLDRIIKAMPRKNGKVSLSERANLLENPLDKRPDLVDPNSQIKDRSKMTGDELLAEMAAADPSVAKHFNLNLSSNGKGN